MIRGVRRRFNEPFVALCETLSEKLDLNELSCAELLAHVVHDEPSDPIEAATRVYHLERRHALYALREVIKGRAALNVCESLRGVLVRVTQELVADGLAPKLCSQIGTLFTKTVPPSRTVWRDLERNIASQCLFYLMYQTPCPDGLFSTGDGEPSPGGPLIPLLPVIRACSAQFDAEKADKGSMMETCYGLLLASLFAGLRYVALEAPPTGNPLASTLFLDRFDEEVVGTQTVWTSLRARAACLWCWSIALLAAKEKEMQEEYTAVLDDEVGHPHQVLDESINGGALEFLGTVVQWPPFGKESDDAPFMAEVIDALLTRFLTTLPEEVRAMRTEEEDSVRALAAWQQFPRGPEPPPGRMYFRSLIKLMSLLYNGRPLLCNQYWQSGVDAPFGGSLVQFLRFAGEQLADAGALSAFADMLGSFACDEESAMHVYNYMRGGISTVCTLDHLFVVIERYRDEYRQEGDAHALPREMSIEEREGLIALLNLMSRVCRHSESVRTILFESESWSTLDSLIGLLGCPISPFLKAAILNALASLARSPRVAAVIWSLMIETQMLPVRKLGQDESGGLRYELEEVESRLEAYPQTLALLDLLLNLFTSVPPASLPRTGSLHTSAVAFVRFVRDDILLKCETRAYQSPTEMWLVASNALHIISKLMSDYFVEDSAPDFVDPRSLVLDGTQTPQKTPGKSEAVQTWSEDYRSPAFFIFSDLLSNRPLLGLLLRLLKPGVASLETAGDASPQHDCVLHALAILHICLLKQEAFIEASRQIPSIHLLSPINTHLNSEREAVLTIADYLTLQSPRAR